MSVSGALDVQEPSAAETAIYNSWSSAYTHATAPPPKLAEMIAVLDSVAVQRSASATAVAIINGGVFEAKTMRDIAVLDATMRLLIRIKEHVKEWPKGPQSVIRGDGDGR